MSADSAHVKKSADSCSPIACSYCCDFYLTPIGCEADRRPTIICAQDHVVCAKCVTTLKNKNLKCPMCQGQILKETRIDHYCMSIVEKFSDERSIPLNELTLSPAPFALGACSDVYDGKWDALDVAVKVLRPVGELRSGKCTFERESKLLQDLDHVNVIRFYGVTTMRNGSFGIVMEKADRNSLVEHWQRMDEQVMIQVSLGINSGLEYLHSRRVVHRDLKPSNILLHGQEMIPKIADFGLSRVISTWTKTSVMNGTVSYMAPEILQEKEYGLSADIYSFTIILYELFSGQEAYPGKSPAQIITTVLGKKYPVISREFPEKMRKLVEHGWSHEPKTRPGLSECREVLQEMLRLSHNQRVGPGHSSTGNTRSDGPAGQVTARRPTDYIPYIIGIIASIVIFAYRKKLF